MIRNGAHTENIEWHIGTPSLNMDDAAFAKRMADAKFIKHIGVINAHIHETKISEQEFLEHVGKNITAGSFLVSAEGFETDTLKRWFDKLSVNGVEIVKRSIAAFFLPKR